MCASVKYRLHKDGFLIHATVWQQLEFIPEHFQLKQIWHVHKITNEKLEVIRSFAVAVELVEPDYNLKNRHRFGVEGLPFERLITLRMSLTS